MRLFLAIAPPEPVLQELIRVQDVLKETISRQGVRFTNTAKLHLTLAFLGDDAEPDEVVPIATSVLSTVGALDLSLTKIGCFPDPRRPKTIWLGVEGDGLIELGERLRDAFSLGDTPYVPHMTLARISPGSQTVGRLLADVAPKIIAEAAWTADSVSLVKTLASGEYEETHRWRLD
jgi:2'-5' RNA ligase